MLFLFHLATKAEQQTDKKLQTTETAGQQIKSYVYPSKPRNHAVNVNANFGQAVRR